MYMGLFFSSKKPAVSGSGVGSSLAHSLDRNSRGKITQKELKFAEKRMIDEVGRHATARIMPGLLASMDSDGHMGGKNISTKEVDTALDSLKKERRWSGVTEHDIEDTKNILSEYQ